MEALLNGLIPRLFPDLPFQCVPHEGKTDLEQSIPRKLRAWREPGVRFLVIRDNDGGDCGALKARLVELCRNGGREDTLVRIACQELEAWYFGAPEALAEAYSDPRLKTIHQRKAFRRPDQIPRPSVALSKLAPEFQKVSGARRMSQVLSRENASPSFQLLMETLEKIAAG